MYSLKEFWQQRNLPVPEGDWDGNVICLETNAEWTFGANETNGFLSCYVYTIVTRGWVTILYNNRELTLHEGDLSTVQQHSIREHRFPKRVEDLDSSACCPSISKSTTTLASTPPNSASPPPTSRVSSVRCQVAAPSLTTSTRCY